MESLKGDLAQTKRSFAADETLADKFAESWDSQSLEWDERGKSIAEELLANNETIEVLNDDDALELFKTHSNSASNLKLISLVLSGKSADSSKVRSMIDETVTLLKDKQGEYDGNKTYCIKGFGQMEDEAKVLAHQVSGHRDAIADYKNQLSNTDACIERNEHIIEDLIDVHVPQVTEEAAEVVKHIPQERVQNCTVEEMVDVPVPWIREKTGQVIQHIPQDRVSDLQGEQIFDIPVPQIQEKLIGMMQLIVQERISEHIGVTLASQIQQKLTEVIKLTLQGQVTERIVEQTVDVPVIMRAKVLAVPVAQETVEISQALFGVQHQGPTVHNMNNKGRGSQTQTDRLVQEGS